MIDYKFIGQTIRLNRERCNITQEQLAELTNVSTDYISKIENAAKRPSLTLLDKLATVLGISMCDFFENPYFKDLELKPQTKIVLNEIIESLIKIDQDF